MSNYTGNQTFQEVRIKEFESYLEKLLNRRKKRLESLEIQRRMGKVSGVKYYSVDSEVAITEVILNTYKEHFKLIKEK